MSTASDSLARKIAPLFLVALLAISTSLSAKETWRGKTVEKEGVRHVMNPANSLAEPETIELEELWRVGGEDDDVLFGVVTDVVAGHDGNFYMLDSQLSEIQVYSPDGEYLRTIGREGEGPGEFRAAFNMLLLPNGNLAVLQAFPSKLVGLTPNGDPADVFKLPDTGDAGFKMLFSALPAGKDLAVVYAFTEPTEGGFTQNNILSLFGPDASNERRLHSQKSGVNGANPVFAETDWDSFRNRWTAGPDGRVYSPVTFGSYEITVWNPDGKVAHVIHREYPTHARNDEQKKEILDIYKGFTRQIPIPGMKYEIEDDWNPVTRVAARDDGTLWVASSRGSIDQPDGIAGVFDVFDKDGRFTRQVTLKGQGDASTDGYFFVKDRLFVVTDFLNAMMALQGGAGDAEEDEDAEPMEIISYKLR